MYKRNINAHRIRVLGAGSGRFLSLKATQNGGRKGKTDSTTSKK